MRVLFLVTARGGSKGVPKKNIAKVAGLPLVAYKIISALRTSVDKRVICSTDSEEIAEVARAYGAEVPFMRPTELARHDSTSLSVIRHAMEWVERNDPTQYDALMLQEPSAPFATYKDHEAAIELFERHEALSVIGMRAVEPHPVWVAELGRQGRMDKHYEQMAWAAEKRRQDFPKVYTMNGALYLLRWEHLMRTGERYTARSYAHVMPRDYSVEIDNAHDLAYACFVVERGFVDISYWR